MTGLVWGDCRRRHLRLRSLIAATEYSTLPPPPPLPPPPHPPPPPPPQPTGPLDGGPNGAIRKPSACSRNAPDYGGLGLVTGNYLLQDRTIDNRCLRHVCRDSNSTQTLRPLLLWIVVAGRRELLLLLHLPIVADFCVKSKLRQTLVADTKADQSAGMFTVLAVSLMKETFCTACVACSCAVGHLGSRRRIYRVASGSGTNWLRADRFDMYDLHCLPIC